MIRLLRRKPRGDPGPTLQAPDSSARLFGDTVVGIDQGKLFLGRWKHRISVGHGSQIGFSSFGREQARQTLSDEAGTKKGARQRCRIPNRRPQSYRNFIQDVHMLGCRSFLRGQEAAAWLSEVLGRRCRLLRRFAGCCRPWNRNFDFEGRIRAGISFGLRV